MAITRRERYKKDPDYRAFVRRCVTISVSVLLVAAIAIFSYFVPFYTLLPAYGIAPRTEGELRLHFLSVGEGDCTIVEFPDGDCLVVDAGDGSFENINHVYRYLKGLAPKSVSVAVTHADSDHCGGAAAILERFPVDTLYLPVLEGGSAYERALRAAEGINKVTLTRYRTISHPSGAYLVCISPYSEGETDVNDASAVLYLHYRGTGALLGADISSVRERRLLREYAVDETIFDRGAYHVDLDIDILKVSHHGSSSASALEWLQVLTPRIAVISCGVGNAYGHPASDAVARLTEVGAQVMRTDEMGDIIVPVSEAVPVS